MAKKTQIQILTDALSQLNILRSYAQQTRYDIGAGRPPQALPVADIENATAVALEFQDVVRNYREQVLRSRDYKRKKKGDGGETAC